MYNWWEAGWRAVDKFEFQGGDSIQDISTLICHRIGKLVELYLKIGKCVEEINA